MGVGVTASVMVVWGGQGGVQHSRGGVQSVSAADSYHTTAGTDVFNAGVKYWVNDDHD